LFVPAVIDIYVPYCKDYKCNVLNDKANDTNKNTKRIKVTLIGPLSGGMVKGAGHTAGQSLQLHLN